MIDASDARYPEPVVTAGCNSDDVRGDIDTVDRDSGVERRLAVYGTLAPGEHNHDQLDGMVGTWVPGIVRGTLYEVEWSMLEGYPGVVLDATGGEVPCQIFESVDLPDHWDRLDDFEGPGYRRVPTIVTTADGEVVAYIYEALLDG